MKKIFITAVVLYFCASKIFAQSEIAYDNYVAVLPSILVEPYDTINAVEINFAPFLYERRFKNNFGLQIRSILNYRFYQPQRGFSQVGYTFLVNKYVSKWLVNNPNMVFNVAIYNSYTYNLLDRINTLTVGIEPGILFKLSEKVSLSVNVQPGINYYPDQYSKDFVNSESGFKSHFGVIVHGGWNF